MKYAGQEAKMMPWGQIMVFGQRKVVRGFYTLWLECWQPLTWEQALNGRRFK